MSNIKRRASWRNAVMRVTDPTSSMCTGKFKRGVSCLDSQELVPGTDRCALVNILREPSPRKRKRPQQKCGRRRRLSAIEKGRSFSRFCVQCGLRIVPHPYSDVSRCSSCAEPSCPKCPPRFSGATGARLEHVEPSFRPLLSSYLGAFCGPSRGREF